MKLNDGEAKETRKENETVEGGENSKANAEKDKPNGVRELNEPITNGVVATVNGDATQDDLTVGTPNPNGKAKQREVDGGMISPESLEAT